MSQSKQTQIHLTFCLYFCAIFLLLMEVESASPIFQTSLALCKTGKVTLGAATSTSSNIDNSVTAFTFPSSFSAAPSVGLGIGYIQISYSTQFVFDNTVTSISTTGASINCNRTTTSVTNVWGVVLNYIAVHPTGFSLQVSMNLLNFSSTTLLSTNSTVRSMNSSITYRNKSNTSNARVALSVVGMQIYTDGSGYTYQIDNLVTLTDTATFTVTTTVQPNNRVSYLRVTAVSYEAVLNNVALDPPYYLTFQTTTDYAGTITLASQFENVTSFGNIFSGLNSWRMSNTNASFSYNLTFTGNTYNVVAPNIPFARNIYIWYREQTCSAGYILVAENHTCEQCHYSCATCTGPSSTECVTCNPSVTFRTITENKQCLCNTGYKDVNTSVCILITCSNRCQTCADIDECKTCYAISRRELVNKDCVCMKYTIQNVDPSQILCDYCHYSCYTCSQAAVATKCLTCNLAIDYRQFVEQNKTCTCTTGYYESSSKVCAKCHRACHTCTNISKCVTCDATKGRIPDTSNTSNSYCICGTGFDDLINEQCKSCKYSCESCTNQTACTKCPSTRNLTNFQCPCLAGYYDDLVSKECQPCQNSCNECNNPDNCTVCSTVFHRLHNSTTLLCYCQAGYYDTFTSEQCSKCNDKCYTCSGGASTDCKSCRATDFRSLDVSGSCLCQNGYFEEVTTSKCSSCHHSCQTCTGVNACVSCDATRNRQATVNSTSGYCDCTPGYYDVGNQTCVKCPSKCLTCDNNGTCLTCQPTTRENGPLCPCKNQTYDDGSDLCKPCKVEYHCQTCTNPINCTSCNAPSRTLSSTAQCICSDGYFGASCLKCNQTCKTCSTTLDNCVKCDSSKNRYLKVDAGKGSCLCYDGYYSDGTSICKSCSYSCLTCSESLKCLTCPSNRVKNTTDQLCYCTAQYYENTAKNCIKCHYSCAQCSSELLCTNCSSSQHRIADPSGLCVCSVGYFDNGVDMLCRDCDKSCKTCKGSSDKCESCDSSLFRQIDTTAKKCVCFKKYYESTVDATCQICSQSCETCSGPSSCLTCAADRVKNVNTGLCDCQPGKIQNNSTGLCQDCMQPCQNCFQTLFTCASCQLTYTLNPSSNTCFCASGTFENYTSCEACTSTCQTCDNSSACSLCRSSDNRQLYGPVQSQSCVCIDGFHSQVGSSVCIKCHYSCQKCTQSTSCQTCKSGRVYINTTSYCACPQLKYFDNGVDAVCQNCEYYCKSCNKISTNCTECDSQKFRRKYTTNQDTNFLTCVCMDKYFGVPNVQTCTPCHYSCATCSNSTACLSCDPSMYRISLAVNTLCSCSGGYFDVTDRHSCSKCNYTCETCSGTDTHCLSCHATRLITVNSCPCRDGYFDSLTNNQVCQTCLYLCKTCKDGISCLSCPDTSRTINSSSLCQCKPGFFDAGELQCRSCSSECEKCSTNATTCTKCYDSQNRELVDNMCICRQGFFNQVGSTNKTCATCHYSCQRCISANQCAACDNLSFRERDATGLCSCLDGYYSDGVNEQCLQCPFGCVTCSDEDTCLSCSPERQLNANDECECKSDYYENNTQCQKCPPECETCVSLSVCLTCNNPTQRTLNNGSCVCNDKLYPTTSSSSSCTACHYSCKTCIAYPRCGSCNSAAHRALSFGQCKCEQKYFDLANTQACQACDYSCLTCTESSSCQTCDTTAVTNRIFNQTTHFCSCKVGLYEDSVLKICIKCMYSCQKCTNSNTCETCLSTSGRTLSNSQCVCSEVGYFDDKSNIQCQQCNPLCYQCLNTKDSCTDCNTNQTLRVLVGDKCVCTGNNFEVSAVNPICSTCNYNCLTCSSVAVCLTCEPAYNRINSPDPNLCPCDTGFYDDGQPQCKLCDYRCQTCINSDSCSTCHSDSYRSNQIGSPFCICMPGYFSSSVQNDYVCQKCMHSCVTCNHASKCLTCVNDITRYYQNEICKCSKGYYDNGVSVSCIKCPIDCQTCSSASVCTNCSFLNNRVFNSLTSKCDCRTGYYDDGQSAACVKCHSSCKACTNGTSCLTCPDNSNQTINATQSLFCICKYGYFKPSGATACKPCYYACERCSSTESTCIECDASAHRYLSFGSCLCQQNYFDTGSSQLCGQCDSPDCLQCYNSLSGQCSKCKPNTYLYYGLCQASCPAGFYEDSSAWTCNACIAQCVDCVNGTSCNQCVNSYYLLPSPTSPSEYYCTNTCPKYYYKSPTHCLPCISPCLQCTQVFICIDCIAGYYKESNSACYPCYSTCRYCLNSTVKGCITCADGYFKNQTLGLCVKLTCGSFEYVSSVYGCYSCSVTYPNSLQCDSEYPLSCKPGYQLITSPTPSCIKCNLIPGYTLIPSTNLCEQICGDSIRYNAPCDDGNTLNGDGCSSTCNVEQNWECNALTNGPSICDIPSRVTLQATVQSVVKVQGANKVKIVIVMNVGVRLLKVNFAISFGSGQKFEYSATTLNSKYTRYLLQIEYFQSVQKEKLSINILSPALSTSASGLSEYNSSTHTSNRLLSSRSPRLLPNSELLAQIEIPLSIDIELLLQIEIETLPPALYYSQQSRQVYTTALFITLVVIHVLTLLTLVYFIFILRIKSMLFTIELLNFVTLLYIYTTYGLYNISELTTQSARALQYFIHKFGDDLPFRYLDTSAGYFGFGSFIVSGCIIQLVIITICAILKLFSQQTTSDKSANSKQSVLNYYHLSFTLAFLPDFMLSIIIIFKWVDIHSSIQSSYSWGIAFILLIMILMTNGIYIINSYAYVRIIKNNIKNYQKRENYNTNAFVQIYDKEEAVQKDIQGLEEADEENGFDNKNTGANFMNNSIEKPQSKNDQSFDPFAEEMSMQRSQKSQKTNRSTNVKAKKSQPLGEAQQQQNRTQALGGASARKYVSSNKQTKTNSETSSLQSNRTHSSKSSTISLLANSPLIPLYDLTPTEIISNSISFSHNQINDSSASVHRILLHHTYLPLKCALLTVLICIFSQIQQPISRCTLLIFCQIATIVYLCLTTRIKNVRTIKLLIMSCILMGISICGLASAIITRVTSNGSWLSSSGNDSLYILQGVIIGLILFGVTGNVAFYILQIIKSQEYWQYKIDKKNEEIIQKNQRKNRLRNVGLNYIHDDSNLNMNKANSGFASGIKNIFSSFKFNDSYNEHNDKNQTKQHLQLDSEVNTPAEYNQNTSNILGGLGNSRKDNFAIVDIEDMNLEEEIEKGQRQNQSDMRMGTYGNKGNSQTSFGAHLNSKSKIEEVEQAKGKFSRNESSSPSKNKSRLSRGIEENIHESYGGSYGKNKDEQGQSSPGKISRTDKSRLELERKKYNESYRLDREKQLMIYTNEHIHENSEEESSQDHPHLQSTRVKEEHFKNPHLIINDKESRQNKRNDFMSRLESELIGEQENDTTFVVAYKKHQRISEEEEMNRENTLISDQSLELKSPPRKNKNVAEKGTKKSYQLNKNMVPTRENGKNSKSRSPPKNNKTPPKNKSPIKSGSPNNRQESIETQQLEEVQKYQNMVKGNQKHYQYGLAGKMSNSKEKAGQRQEKIEEGNLGLNKNTKSTVQVRSKQKNSKLKRAETNPSELMKIQNKSPSKQKQNQSDEEYEQIGERKYKLSSKDPLPDGIKSTKDGGLVSKYRGHDASIGEQEDVISTKMRAKRGSPHKGKKIKRIDSISSIGSDIEGDYPFYEQGEQDQSEGASVFKKLLKDYEVYRHKKVNRNMIKKR